MRIHGQGPLPSVFRPAWIIQLPIGPADSALHVGKVRCESKTFSPGRDCFARPSGNEQSAAKAVVQLGTVRIGVGDALVEDRYSLFSLIWRSRVNQLPTHGYNLLEIMLLPS